MSYVIVKGSAPHLPRHLQRPHICLLAALGSPECRPDEHVECATSIEDSNVDLDFVEYHLVPQH
jgi:hypothetical protein